MIDITPFCVKLERHIDDRFRLVIFTAPGMSGYLAQQLRRYKVRRKNARAVVCHKPEHVRTLARELGMEAPLLGLLDRYASCWVQGRRGVRNDPELLKARKTIFEQIGAYLTGSEGSGSGSDPHPI